LEAFLVADLATAARGLLERDLDLALELGWFD
jgi:hypothetical protein